jgi:hypothetical protein
MPAEDSPRKRTEPEETVGVSYWPGPIVCSEMSTLSPGATETARPLLELSRLIRSVERWQDAASRAIATPVVSLKESAEDTRGS